MKVRNNPKNDQNFVNIGLMFSYDWCIQYTQYQLNLRRSPRIPQNSCLLWHGHDLFFNLEYVFRKAYSHWVKYSVVAS